MGSPVGLLRGHVHRGAGDVAALGQARVVRRAGEAEVGDLDRARAPFSSRMLAGLMSRWTRPCLCAAASPSAICEPIRRISAAANGPSFDLVLQRDAVDVFHDQVRQVLLLVDRMNRDDMGMDHGGGGLGLARKPLAGGRIGGELGGEDLHGDRAVQPAVVGLEYHPHRAPADDPDDLVRAQHSQAIGSLAGAEETPRSSVASPLCGGSASKADVASGRSRRVGEGSGTSPASSCCASNASTRRRKTPSRPQASAT